MKKIIALLLAILMLLSLCACGNVQSNSQQDQSEPETSSSEITCEHTVKIGECKNCFTFVNHEHYQQVLDKLVELEANLRVGYDYTDYGTTPRVELTSTIFLPMIENADPIYQKEKTNLESLIEFFGDYDELSEIKSKLQSALNEYPVKPTETNFDATYKYISDAHSCYMLVDEAMKNLTYFR